jgi:hypothetical protein
MARTLLVLSLAPPASGLLSARVQLLNQLAFLRIAGTELLFTADGKFLPAPQAMRSRRLQSCAQCFPVLLVTHSAPTRRLHDRNRALRVAGGRSCVSDPYCRTYSIAKLLGDTRSERGQRTLVAGDDCVLLSGILETCSNYRVSSDNSAR